MAAVQGLDKEELRAYFAGFGKVEAMAVATYNDVFLTCKRTTADIHERLSIIEAKVAKAQQLAKEQVWLHAPCLVATGTSC